MDNPLIVRPRAGSRFTLWAALALALLRCTDASSPSASLTNGDAASNSGPVQHAASIRLVNAATEVGALTVLAEVGPLSAAVEPLAASGTVAVAPNVALSLSADSGETLSVAAPNGAWQDGQHYTIVAVTGADRGISAKAIVDPLSPPRGLRRLRVVNGLIDGLVSIAIAESEFDATETRVASALPAGGASGSVDVASTATDLRVNAGDRFLRCPLGADLGARLVLVPTRTLAGQPTVLAVDELTATVLECVEPNPHASVRVVHAAIAEERLGIAYGGDAIATVAFSGTSAYTTVRAGETADLVVSHFVQPGGDGGNVALTIPTRFEPASKTTLVAITTLVANTMTLGVEANALAVVETDDSTDQRWLINALPETVHVPLPVIPGGATPIPSGSLAVAVATGHVVCDIPSGARHVVLLPTESGVSVLIDSPGEAAVQSTCSPEKVPTSYIEFVAAAAVGPVDITRDGATTPLVTALPPLTASAMLPFPTGTAVLHVSAPGADATDVVVGAAKEGETLRAVVGGYASGLFARALARQIDAGRVDLRLIDGTDTAPAMTLWVELAAADGATPSWTHVGQFYGQDLGSFDAPGVVRFGVDPTGSNDGPRLICDGASLGSPRAADIVLLAANEAGDDATIGVWTDALTVFGCQAPGPPPLSKVRVVMAARLATSVTVTAADVVRTLAFGDASAYADAPSDSFSAAATSGALTTNYGPVSLDAEARYTLAVVGNASGIGTLLLTDAAAIPPSLGALRFVNTAAGSGGVTLAVVTPSGEVPVAAALGFGAVAPQLNVNPGPVDLAVSLVGGDTVRCAIPAIEAGSLTVAFVVTTPEGARALIVLRDGSAATTVLCAPPVDGVVHVLNASTTPTAVTVDAVSTGAQVGTLVPLTLGLPKGQHAITLTPVPGGAAASASVDVSTGSQTTLIGLGTPLSALALAHGVAAIGTTRVRIVSALDGAAVTVSLEASDGAVKPLGSLAIGVATAATIVASGTLSVMVDLDGNGAADLDCPVAAGSGDSVHATLVRKDGDIALWIDLRGAEPTMVACTVPAPSPALVRVVHLTPSANLVDLYAGGVPITSGLVYTKSTGALSVDTNVALLALASPSGAPIAALPAGTLTPGASVTIALYGAATTGANASMAAFTDVTTPPTPGSVRYRVINASSVASLGALSLSGLPVPVATGLTPGHTTAYLSAAGGPLTLGVDLTGDGVADRSCATALGADQTYNVLIFGDSAAVALCVESGGVTALVPCKPVD